MARTRDIIVGILSFGLLASALLTTSPSTQANHRTHNYTIIGGNPDVTYYANFSVPFPAMAAENVYLNVPKFEYPKPANDGKYDNRMKSFAQYQRSWNVASHYRS